MDVQIDLDVIKRLRIAHKTTKANKIKSVNFYKDGKCLAFNTDDEVAFIVLGDVISEFKRALEKHGCRLSIFLNESLIIHTSWKLDFNLRLLNFETNKYQLEFPGHSKEVVSLDAFGNHIASGSKDTTVRLWDYREDHRRQGSRSRLTFATTPLVTFHPSGSFLVIAHSSHVIEFHDLRDVKAVTQTIKLRKQEGVEWTSIKFSSDSTMLLVTTKSSLIVVISIVEKVERLNLRDFDNRAELSTGDFIGACFTPKSDFILGGSSGGSIPVWRTDSPFKLHTIPKYQEFNVCRKVVFNPEYVNMATVHDSDEGGSILSLWNEKDFRR